MYSYPVQLLGRLFLKTLLSSSHKSKEEIETIPNSRKVKKRWKLFSGPKQQLLLLSELPLVGGRLIEKHQSANNKQLKAQFNDTWLMMMRRPGGIDEQGGIRDGSSSGSQGSQGSD